MGGGSSPEKIKFTIYILYIWNIYFHYYLSVNSVDEIENVALGKFVSEVAENILHVDSTTIVFAFELAGWLGGSIDRYRHFKGCIHHLFLTVWNKLELEVLCDVSITTALYESLTSLVSHRDGLLWIVHEKNMEGL